jgi:hypothetical protein
MVEAPGLDIKTDVFSSATKQLTVMKQYGILP